MNWLIGWLFKGWAEEALRQRVADAERALDVANHKVKLLEVERDGLAAVVARDRQRVNAETAELAVRQAKAGG